MFIRAKKLLLYLRSLPHKEKPFKEIVGLLLQFSHLSGMLTINRQIYKIRFHPHSSIALHLWLYPESRMTEENVVRNYVRSGDTVVDVGANVGTITLAAAALAGSSGRVVAIEPHPTIFNHLQDNGKLNGFNNIHFLNSVVGSEDGTISFSDRMSDDQNRVVSRSRLQVKIQPLDALLEAFDLKRVNFLKIDVEGFEKHVLQGAPKTLARTDCVFFETSGSALAQYGDCLDDVFAILRSHHFRLYRVGKDMGNALALKEDLDLSARFGTAVLSPIIP